jgi:hypothetical protein
MQEQVFPSKTKKAEPEVDSHGMKIITKKYLRQLCEENELYMTAHLNDKLYVHFKGFTKIENLDDYINVKSLFIDNNCFQKIENLHMFKQLRCLFLQYNLIPKIEGLEELTELVTLNLSHNQITKIEGLSTLVNLQTFDISHNYIEKAEDIVGLLDCPSLTNVDISTNKLIYSENLIEIFMGMRNVACVYLKNNPLVRDFPHYRKNMISSLPSLLYLDDKPVFDLERRTSDAWRKGGKEAEANERNKYFEEKREREKQDLSENKEREEKARARRKKELERIERECKDNQSRLLQMKEELINKGIEDSTSLSMIKQIDLELERVKELWDVKEDKVEQIMDQEYNKMPKYKCLYASKDKDGKDVYADQNQEDVEKHKNGKLEEWAAEEEKQRTAKEQLILQENSGSSEPVLENKEKEKSTNDETKGFHWTQANEELLETLLENHMFEFAKVTPEFNDTVNNKLTEGNLVPFSEEDLRKKWTQIETDRYRKHVEMLENPAKPNNKSVREQPVLPEKNLAQFDELE